MLSLLFSATLALALAAQSPQPALLLELGEHRHAQVQALTGRIEAAGGWWLEMETQLLLVAPASQLDNLATGYEIQQRLPTLTPQSLALQARACGVSSDSQLPAIALTGRFALVWAPRRFVGYAMPDSSEWREVQPNEVLSRDQSLRGSAGVPKGGADPQIQARVNAVDPQRWFAALTSLASYDRSSYGTLPTQIDGARDWLAARFSELGMTPELQTFTFSSASPENVIATLPGSSLPDEWIVVGGHYDSRNTSNTSSGVSNTPGAEDNASGCAGVLEMARVLSEFQHQRTLVFVCFAGEEQGLYGSNAFAQKLVTDGNLDKVKLALLMDMIGYSGDTDLDMLLETTSAFSLLFSNFTTMQPLYAPELRVVTSTNACCSDHMPFLNRNVPSILVSENDWNVYPHYHKSTDIPSNISRALDMGGGILKMDAAIIAAAARPVTDQLLANGFE